MASVYAIIDVAKNFRPKAGFALKTMLSAFFLYDEIQVLRVEEAKSLAEVEGAILVYYGPQQNFGLVKADVSIAHDDNAVSFFDKKHPFSPKRIFFTGAEKTPVLFGTKKITDHKNGYIFADLVASAFYFLSDWDALTILSKDQHGRTPYTESLAGKLGLAERPIVNEYCNLIRDVTESRRSITLSQKKFGDSTFAACITHDFDRIKKKYKGTVKRELYDLPIKNPLNQAAGERFGRAKQSLIDLLRSEDGYERSILGMFDFERKLGTRPTVLFKSILQKHERDAADYLDYPFMETIIGKIDQLNGECGLHASYIAGYDEALFSDEKKKLEKRLGKYVLSHRFHYLRFNPSTIAGMLSKNGIRYDSSVGWAEQSGFRSGFTYPYYLFDPERNTTSDVLEIPMQMMEVQLFNYQGLDASEAVEAAKRQADIVKKYGGVLCWNFHHHALDHIEVKGGSVLFEQSLSYLQTLNPSFLTLGAVHENL
ncbi:MAG: hypothetical protein LAT84_01685 [Balneolia bacterium]|nr:hypothetical protein [Balneolia bacterium]